MKRSNFGLAAAAAALLATTPVAAQPAPPVVLVHGAFEDGSGWTPVAEALRGRGHAVTTVVLPGRKGGSPEAAEGVTLAAHRDAVLVALAAQPAPSVLVGHSFGGIVISAAAEAAPERVRSLVYLAAYLPRDGESLLALASRDTGSELGPAFQVDEPRGVATVRPDVRAALFCGGCDTARGAAVATAMVAEPLAGPVTPVALTPARFGAVDKVYIRTEADRVVSPALQTAMLAATPVRRELRLAAGHAPFNAQPAAVAEAIAEAARR